jgi:S-formylglutathione hydrolase FrmB
LFEVNSIKIEIHQKSIIMKKQTLLSALIVLVISANCQPFMKLDARFYSEALDEERMVDIYLPSDYFVNTDIHYPTIYYLHGAGGNQNEGYMDAMAYYSQYHSDTVHEAPPAILVSPDGGCEPYSGSGYVNSPLYGDFEDYISQDLIEFIDENFRTIPEKDFRFITGYSMGGFGSAYHAIRRPELFRGCAPSSACFLNMQDTVINTWEEHLVAENGGYHFDPDGGEWSSLFFTISGVFAANMGLPPYHIEMLWDTNGNLVDSVREKMDDFDCYILADDLTPDENVSFYLLCGTIDKYIAYPPYLTFANLLEEKGIEYVEHYHQYDHGIFDPESHMVMYRWMDSLIADAYIHLSVDENRYQRQTTGLNLQVYPNPTSGQLNINYQPPNRKSQMSELVIEVCNGQGIPVKTINPSGNGPVRVDLSMYPAGIYFVRVQAEGILETRKVVLLK